MLITLSSNPLPVTVEGKWLYVKEASADITVYFPEKGDKLALAKSSVYKDSEEIGRILLTGNGQVEILFGRGDFVPPSENRAVSIEQMPVVTVEEMPPVNVATLPLVTIEQMPKVDINTIPSVVVSTLPAVTVNSLPNVAVDSLPNVSVDSLPSVEVSTLPAVTVETLPDVNVASLPAVDINSLPEVKIQREIINVSGSTISEFPYTVAANVDRKLIRIISLETNTNTVTINGIPLTVGSEIELPANGELIISDGVADTDYLTIVEFIYE